MIDTYKPTSLMLAMDDVTRKRLSNMYANGEVWKINFEDQAAIRAECESMPWLGVDLKDQDIAELLAGNEVVK